jgi:LEA14-like dessication related protein
VVRAFLVAAVVSWLAGCNSMGPKIAVPQISIAQIAMTSADMFNQQFLVRVRVENPNDREMTVKKIEYELFLEGDAFAEGDSAKVFVVPAMSETDFDMVVRSNFVSALGRLVSRLNGRTQVNYVFEGTLHVEIGSSKKIPFQQSGTVNLALMK